MSRSIDNSLTLLAAALLPTAELCAGASWHGGLAKKAHETRFYTGQRHRSGLGVAPH